MRYYAFEGRIFVISSAAVWSEQMKEVLELNAEARARFFCDGGHSGILNPMGDYIAGPQDGGEGILHADLDLAEVTRGRILQDVTGHYQRFDVFSLHVNRQPYGRGVASAPPEGAVLPAAETTERGDSEAKDKSGELVSGHGGPIRGDLSPLHSK